MAYDAVRVDEVYDSFIKLAPKQDGREDSECRARIDYQIIGLPVPERKTEGNAPEVPWMR
jgi:hypothetical protein